MATGQNLNVLVKKSDGTFERVPLSELKNRRAKAAVVPAKIEPQQPAQPGLQPRPAEKRPLSQPVSTPKPAPKMLMKEETNLPANITEELPMVKPILPAPMNVKQPAPKEKIIVKKQDFSSPLEEASPIVKTSGAPALSPTRVNEALAIVNKLSFKVLPDYTNRLRTVIQLRLKDIRDDDQTKNILVSPLNNGGLSLLPSQADEVLRACATLNAPARRSTLPTSSKTSLVQTRPVAQPAAPSSSTEKFTLRSTPTVKQVVKDMAATPREIGPVDEIRNFTLTDFRRLADDPKQASARLKQKFINLLEESYVLYMQALFAWKKSPLFLEYVRAVSESIARDRRLVAVLGGSGLKTEELRALVAMETDLERM